MNNADLLDGAIFRGDIKRDSIESVTVRSVTAELHLNFHYRKELKDFIVDMFKGDSIISGGFIYGLSYESVYRKLSNL